MLYRADSRQTFLHVHIASRIQMRMNVTYDNNPAYA